MIALFSDPTPKTVTNHHAFRSLVLMAAFAKFVNMVDQGAPDEQHRTDQCI